MGTTNIEWTATVNADGSVTPGKTWNPTRGCSRVSQGCVNCYAEKLAGRYSAYGDKPDSPFREYVTKVNGHASWTGKVELIESMLDAPLHWKKPCRIFVNSMSDLFHEALADEDLDRVFAVMALCPQHTFQVLTKRPARMVKYVADRQSPFRVAKAIDRYTVTSPLVWPLTNCWCGVSVEDQATADERIPLLLQTPAAIRFVSYEPALGPVDFLQLQGPSLTGPDEIFPHWIIVGGESGPGARPFDIAWAESTVEQCAAAGVACFVKQLGAKPHDGPGGPWRCNDRKGGDISEFPENIRVRQFPEVAR